MSKIFSATLAKRLISHLVVAGLGISVGAFWLAPNNSTSNKEIAVSQEQPIKLIEAITSDVNDTSVATTTIATNTQTSNNQSIAEAFSNNSDTNIANNENSSDESEFLYSEDASQYGELGNLLAGLDISVVESGENIQPLIDRLIEVIKASDNPGQMVFNYLNSDVDDNTKHVLEWLIASQPIDKLSESIVNQLIVADESEYSNWENILNMVPISSSIARDNLMSTLPLITNEQLVATAINAIQPSIVSPDERAQFLSEVVSYTNSENNDIQAASIETLSRWAAHDYAYVIVDALQNGSFETKKNALYSISDGSIHSDGIKQSMLSILNDENQPLELRVDTFNALTFYPLNEQEYSLYYNFYTVNILPLEQRFTN